MEIHELMDCITRIESSLEEARRQTFLAIDRAVETVEVATRARNYASEVEAKARELSLNLNCLEQQLSEMRNAANRLE